MTWRRHCAWGLVLCCTAEGALEPAARSVEQASAESSGAAAPLPPGGGIAMTGGITLCAADDCASTSLVPGSCGDGALTADEACDDGNRTDGDGCAASCLLVEAGYSCSPPGSSCHVVALCGDGIIATNELCDDGNALDGD